MQKTIDLPDDLVVVAEAVARDMNASLDEAVVFLMRRGVARDRVPYLTIDPITGHAVLAGGPLITSEDVKALEDEW